MRFRSIAIICFLATVVVAKPSVWSRAAGPKGTLMVSTPTLMWQVWGDKGSVIESVWCKIDGVEAPASYSESRKRIEAQPRRALAPGTHKIEMGATSNDEISVNKEWNIQVLSEAETQVPSVSSNQELVLSRVNAFRAELGLAPVSISPAMCAASQQHAKYLAENRLTGHFQGEGSPLFVGVTPSDRLNAYGYTGGSMEVVQSGRSNLDEALSMLIAAPYHRQAFLGSGSVEAGGAQYGERLVIVFGDILSPQLVVHPFDGQTNVPTAWSGNERPNPLRLHRNMTAPTGYPIVFCRATTEPDPIKVLGATLVKLPEGTPVEFALNSPSNDTELTDSAFLIPCKPLLPQTTYRAQVSAKDPKGTDISRSWSFRTR